MADAAHTASSLAHAFPAAEVWACDGILNCKRRVKYAQCNGQQHYQQSSLLFQSQDHIRTWRRHSRHAHHSYQDMYWEALHAKLNELDGATIFLRGSIRTYAAISTLKTNVADTSLTLHVTRPVAHAIVGANAIHSCRHQSYYAEHQW